VAMSHEPIGNQHAMATKINSLRAHIGVRECSGKFDQLGDALLEFFSEHVIRIVRKLSLRSAMLASRRGSFCGVHQVP